MRRLAMLPEYRHVLGVFATPRGGHNADYISDLGLVWGMDNDVYAGRFKPSAFTAALDRYRSVKSLCRFVLAPDVRCYCLSTLHWFEAWQPTIRAYGYPVGFAAQDGIEKRAIPWDRFDALFVGGSDGWRHSAAVVELCREAKSRGKWLHIGRVNSYKRIRWCQFLGADSVDGTHFSREPRQIARKALACSQQMLW